MDDTKTENICRACLTEEGEFQSVFVSDERTGLTIHLAEMIMAYASVQITLGDGLPEQICISCAQKVADAFIFKQQCEASDTSLRARFGRSPLTKPYSIKEELMASSVEVAETLDIIIKPEIHLEGDSDAEYQDENETNNVSIESPDNDEKEIIYEPQTNTTTSKPSQERECDICHKVFSRPSHLNRHKKIHLANKQYFCEICNKGFSRNDLKLRHQVIHNMDSMEIEKLDDESTSESEDDPDDKDFFLEQLESGIRCTVCTKRFYKHETLAQHMKNVHGGDDQGESASEEKKEEENDSSSGGGGSGGGGVITCISCKVCGKKFTKQSHLTRHLKIHAAIKAHVCQLCNKGFARGEQLMNHMNVHTGVKPHVCKICEKGFNQISNLKDHMRTHNGEKPFLCSICGKGFNQLGNLRQHTIRHSGVKAHLCSICGNGFASKGELGAHLRKHTGARPFVCQVCNHGFTTSSSLTKHKRIHSGEKPYECEVCKMKFSRSGILARHKRTHTGEKPYVCKFCSKAFSQSNDLSSHLRIHTGEKPYICDCCGQAFRQSSALKTHKKTHMDRALIDARNSIPIGMVTASLIHSLQ